MENALVNLMRAESLFRAQGRVYRQTWLTIAWCFQLKREREKARAYAEEVSAQPMRTEFDQIDQLKLEALLAKLS